MYSFNSKTWLVFIVSLAFFYAAVASNAAAGKGGDTSGNEELFSLAKKVASNHGLNVDEYDLRRVEREDGLTTVEFWPRSSPPQTGGGCTIVFKKEGDKYEFVRLEGWQ